MPPRHPAGKPQQWFIFRPWVFDVTLAGALLRATPRPAQTISVEAWAHAYGLDRDPDSGRHAISLIGPGPDFSPQYAMTTDPDEPVILATLTSPAGEPAGPLLIDGYALSVTVRSYAGSSAWATPRGCYWRTRCRCRCPGTAGSPPRGQKSHRLAEERAVRAGAKDRVGLGL